MLKRKEKGFSHKTRMTGLKGQCNQNRAGIKIKKVPGEETVNCGLGAGPPHGATRVYSELHDPTRQPLGLSFQGLYTRKH